jgi:hypothetical protein
MSFYSSKSDLLKEDVQLARSYGITIDEQDLVRFIEQLVVNRAEQVHQWHQRQIDLDTFD